MLTCVPLLTLPSAAVAIAHVRETSPPTNQALGSLPFDDLVELAALLRDSRRSAKRFLNARRLMNDAAALEAAELYLRRRPDWPKLEAAAAAAIERHLALANETFDLRLAIANRLKRAGILTREDRASLAADAGVNASLLEALIDGGDPPTSVASQVLAALGARRVQFDLR